MKKFFSKYFEFIILGLTIIFLLTKPAFPKFGERISMIFFGTLSFYYLASGVLVFLDKNRIGRIMRLMYLFGLWSVSFSVLAIMTRTLLMQMDKELLMISVSSGIGLMLFMLLYYIRLKTEDRETFKYLIQPLFVRSLLAIFIATAFLLAGNYGIYNMFGTHKKDPVYIEKAVNAYEHPEDSAIVNDFKNYDADLRGDSVSVGSGQ
ncbi:MAG: hypothetical protein ACHQFW_10375 [Chitinophagales bacterium]